MKKRGGYSGLSLRETEVLNHMGEGMTNQDISSVLGISERTVEKHLERIYKKLGVASRTAAVVFFLNNKDYKGSKLASLSGIRMFTYLQS
jgi:DNA-binding CsgD family transcriptional regulator